MKGGWGWGARGSTRLVSEFEKTREDARAHLLEAVVGGAGELLLDGFLGAPAEREREVLGGDLLTLGGGFVRARPRRVSFPGGAHRGGGRRARPLLLLLVVGHVAGRRRDVRARVRRRVRPSGVAGKGLAVRRRASRCAGLNRGDRRAKQKCDESVFRNRATRSLATEFRDWKLIRDVDPYFERSCRSSLPSRRGGGLQVPPREVRTQHTRASSYRRRREVNRAPEVVRRVVHARAFYFRGARSRRDAPGASFPGSPRRPEIARFAHRSKSPHPRRSP